MSVIITLFKEIFVPDVQTVGGSGENAQIKRNVSKSGRTSSRSGSYLINEHVVGLHSIMTFTNQLMSRAHI